MTHRRGDAEGRKEQQGQETQVRHILEFDRTWAAYALADLQPGFAEQCAWFMHEDGPGASGLVMMYAGLTPPILFALGQGEAVAATLEQAAGAGALPDEVYLSIREEHEAAVGRWFDLSAAWDDRRPMVRMVLAADVAPPQANQPPVVRLTAADAPRIEALFAHGGPFAPDAFDAGQIENGVFCGIEQAGELVAAGGTHIVDRQEGVAAIGNFYTCAGQRGKGYAGALLGAIVRDLRAGGVESIVLNVDQRNHGAQRLYQRHGFAAHCEFVEGCVGRNSIFEDR